MWVSLLNSLLVKLFKTGDFHLTLHDGRTFTYGDGSGVCVKVRLMTHDLPKRIVKDPELAVGEAYMNAEFIIENDDIHGFLRLAQTNLNGRRLSNWWQRVLPGLKVLAMRVSQYNPVGKAQSNVARHYDLSAELYNLFLDADKQYSSGYFRNPDNSLEQAQIDKKNHIAGKLLIEPGMRVLDIGCGWGGMGLTLAQDFGAEVIGVTLSTEQHLVATQRATAAGLSDRVDFRLMDYRHVEGQFDRIVSVGMFEHVGAPHFREYFRHVSNLLSPDGIALVHTIGRPVEKANTSPWIEKYIFPGGYVPCLSEMMSAIEDEKLITTDVEVWRLHYAYTLMHWHDRFVANREKVLALYDERFYRMWRYYLVAAEMSFRVGNQNVFQVQLVHRQDAVPLTRDYLYSGR